MCCSTAAVLWGVTCYFVADEFGGLDIADTAEKTAKLVLTHALRQVVHNQVGPRILVLHQLLAIPIIVQLLRPQPHSNTSNTAESANQQHENHKIQIFFSDMGQHL